MQVSYLRVGFSELHFSSCKCVIGSCKRRWAWASYQIHKIAGCACTGNAGNVSPRRRFHRKPLVSDPSMHHGTCVTHVPWCMSGSLTCGDGENVPGILGACAPAILRIWQEAHWNEGIIWPGSDHCDKLWFVNTWRRYFQTHFIEWKC